MIGNNNENIIKFSRIERRIQDTNHTFTQTKAHIDKIFDDGKKNKITKLTNMINNRPYIYENNKPDREE